MPDVSDASPSNILTVIITGNQGAPSSSMGHAILLTGTRDSLTVPGISNGIYVSLYPGSRENCVSCNKSDIWQELDLYLPPERGNYSSQKGHFHTLDVDRKIDPLTPDQKTARGDKELSFNVSQEEIREIENKFKEIMSKGKLEYRLADVDHSDTSSDRIYFNCSSLVWYLLWQIGLNGSITIPTQQPRSFIAALANGVSWSEVLKHCTKLLPHILTENLLRNLPILGAVFLFGTACLSNLRSTIHSYMLSPFWLREYLEVRLASLLVNSQSTTVRSPLLPSQPPSDNGNLAPSLSTPGATGSCRR